MNSKPVYWRQFYLTDVHVYDKSDWKGHNSPGEADFERIHSIQIGEALYRALEKAPVCPDKDLAQSVQWVEVVLKEICSAVQPGRKSIEAPAMKFYIHKHGMNQLLEIYGADIQRILIEIDNMTSR